MKGTALWISLCIILWNQFTGSAAFSYDYWQWGPQKSSAVFNHLSQYCKQNTHACGNFAGLHVVVAGPHNPEDESLVRGMNALAKPENFPYVRGVQVTYFRYTMDPFTRDLPLITNDKVKFGAVERKNRIVSCGSGLFMTLWYMGKKYLNTFISQDVKRFDESPSQALVALVYGEVPVMRYKMGIFYFRRNFFYAGELQELLYFDFKFSQLHFIVFKQHSYLWIEFLERVSPAVGSILYLEDLLNNKVNINTLYDTIVSARDTATLFRSSKYESYRATTFWQYHVWRQMFLYAKEYNADGVIEALSAKSKLAIHMHIPSIVDVALKNVLYNYKERSDFFVVAFEDIVEQNLTQFNLKNTAIDLYAYRYEKDGTVNNINMNTGKVDFSFIYPITYSHRSVMDDEPNFFAINEALRKPYSDLLSNPKIQTFTYSGENGKPKEIPLYKYVYSTQVQALLASDWYYLTSGLVYSIETGILKESDLVKFVSKVLDKGFLTILFTTPTLYGTYDTLISAIQTLSYSTPALLQMEYRDILMRRLNTMYYYQEIAKAFENGPMIENIDQIAVVIMLPMHIRNPIYKGYVDYVMRSMHIIDSTIRYRANVKINYHYVEYGSLDLYNQDMFCHVKFSGDLKNDHYNNIASYINSKLPFNERLNTGLLYLKSCYGYASAHMSEASNGKVVFIIFNEDGLITSNNFVATRSRVKRGSSSNKKQNSTVDTDYGALYDHLYNINQGIRGGNGEVRKLEAKLDTKVPLTSKVGVRPAFVPPEPNSEVSKSEPGKRAVKDQFPDYMKDLFDKSIVILPIFQETYTEMENNLELGSSNLNFMVDALNIPFSIVSMVYLGLLNLENS